MPLDFPLNPQPGDTFEDWTWTGDRWSVIGRGAIVPIAGNRTLIQRVDVTSPRAMVEFHGIDETYDEYEVVGLDVVVSGAYAQLRMRVNQDDGATWLAGANYTWTNHSTDHNGTATAGGISGDDSGYAGVLGNVYPGIFYMQLSKPGRSGAIGTPYLATSTGYVANALYRTTSGGLIFGYSSRITALAFFAAQLTANFTRGTFLLYGINRKTIVDDLGSTIQDAPSGDGISYGRRDGAWKSVLPLSGGTLTGPLDVLAPLGTTGNISAGGNLTVGGQASINTNLIVGAGGGGNSLYCAGPIYPYYPSNFALLQDGAYNYLQWNTGWGFYWQRSNGNLYVAAANVLAILGRSDGAWFSQLSDCGGLYGYQIVSDAKLKKDIAPCARGLDAVLQLKPVQYHGIKEDSAAPLHYGFTAQDLEPVIPEAVRRYKEKDGDEEELRRTDSDIIPVMVRAIQQLSQRVEALSNEIAEMKKK